MTETNEDWDSVFHGPVYARKKKALDSALLEIEQNHKDYFEGRKPKFPYEKQERLHNHYMTAMQNGWFSFNFRKDSDLPQHIKDEFRDAVDRIMKED